MSERTLIRGGCVLTLGARTQNYAEADVLVEDGRIAEVGPGLRARDAEQVDATDTIVMPGFVDTHRHAWRSLFRNLGDESANGHEYSPEDLYAATLVGLLGAVEAGITSVVDWSDPGFGDAHLEATAQAHADAGLRTVLVHEHPGRMERSSEAGPLTSIAFGADRGGNLDQIGTDWERARRLGLRIHAHAATTPDDRGSVAALGARKLLGPDVTLVHCTHAGDADADAIASSGTAVAVTPSSEMAGGMGAPPMQALIDRNIRPGLGVGSERVAPGDMFAQMRAAISIQHATLFDLKLAGKAGVPKLLSTRDVIRYATSDGARAAGLGETTGSIEPGKRADIVVLRTDRPNITPVNDPIGAVVWGMDTSNVDWVFADGSALMRNGELVADVAEVRSLARAAQDRAAASLVAGPAGGER